MKQEQTDEKQTTNPKKILETKKLFENATQTQRTEIAEIYDAFMGKMPEKKYPWKHDDFIPKMRTEFSYILPFIFSGEPEIEVQGVGLEDKELSGYLEKMVNYRIQQSIPNAYEKIGDWVIQGCAMGTSLIQPVWVFETAEKEEQDEMGQTVKYQVPVKDEPDLIVPHILDCYYNPLIATVEKQECLIVRASLPLSSVKGNPAYQNTEQVEAKKSFQANPYDSSSLDKADINNSDALQSGTDMIELIEYWTKDRIVTIADGKTCVTLRDVENPDGFIPLVKFNFEKRPHVNRFDGFGMGHNTLGIQSMYYNAFNRLQDNEEIVVNRMFKYKKGAKIDTKQFVAKPGGGIGVDNMDDVQELPVSDIKQSAFEMLNRIDDEHKRASGGTDLIQGSASNDTATQDRIAQSNVTNRFDLVRKRFKVALAELAAMLIKMEIRNLQSPDAQILRIFPEETRGMIYQMIISQAEDLKFNVKVRGETIVSQNKDVIAKQLIDLFSVFGQMLTPNEQRAWARRILELRGQQDIDTLVAEEAPMPQPTVDEMGNPIQGAGTEQGIDQSTYQQ